MRSPAIAVTAAWVAAALFAAAANADVRYMHLEEIVESSEMIVRGEVTGIEAVQVGKSAWDAATINVSEVVLDRATEKRKPKTVTLYVAQQPPPGVWVEDKPPQVKVGQKGIWFLDAPRNFVGYRHGYQRHMSDDDLARVKAVIAAERDPMAALRSKSAAERVSGAYFWLSTHGAKGHTRNAVRKAASKETTDLVLDALASGLSDAGGFVWSLANDLVGEYGLPHREIFPPGVRRAEYPRRFAAWRAKHPDFRLSEYVEPGEEK
jgi:hypothetical protein